MILVYKYNQRAIFFNRTYSDKGIRIGQLIEGDHSYWNFWPTSGVSIPADVLIEIAEKSKQLRAASLRSLQPVGGDEDPPWVTRLIKQNPSQNEP